MAQQFTQPQAQYWLRAKGIDCSRDELERSAAKLQALAADPDARESDPAIQKQLERVTRLGEALGIAVDSFFQDAPPDASQIEG